jgi:hypothetical protein
MQLNPKTISVLKNFSTINPSIVLKSGNAVATISPNKTIMAKATVPDSFEGTYGIYALNQFISSMSLFDTPSLEFGSESVRIGDSSRSVVYYYSDPSVILTPPEKEIKLPSVDVEFRLTSKDLQSVMKALGVLGLPEIAVVGEGGNIFIKAIDSKSPTTNNYSIKVGETDKSFRAIFRAENMKMMDGDYDVQISSKGISQFTGPDISYWIAVEASSTF